MDPFDSFGPSFGILGSALFLLPVALYGLVYPYLVLRLRPVTPDQPQDPQVGLKCALYFVFSLGILMMLIGATQFLLDLIIAGNWFERAGSRLERFDNSLRSACAVMASGGLFAFLHLLLIMGFTNNHSFPEVRRVWVGWRFAIHSLVVLAATTLLIFYVFLKNAPDSLVQIAVGLLLVWGPSWFIHLLLLQGYRGIGSLPKAVRKKRDEDGDEGERPIRPIAPQRPTQPSPGGQQQQQQTGQRPVPGQQPAQRPAPLAQPVQRPVQAPPPQRPAPRKPQEDDED